MIAGEVVTLPRRGVLVCEGCRRCWPVGAIVALYTPDGGWVPACPPCFRGEPVGSWLGVPGRWDGAEWAGCWVDPPPSP
jgi:hypothetical protein